MTSQERKSAFKGSILSGVLTLVLCWIICWFFNGAYAETDVSFASCAKASGISCFITPVISGLITYPIVLSVFKKNKETDPQQKAQSGEAAADELGKQVIFFSWIPKNWFCYALVFAVINCVFWGFGVPSLLDLLIPISIPAGVGSRIFVTGIGGVQIAASAQYCAYLFNMYAIRMLKVKNAR